MIVHNYRNMPPTELESFSANIILRIKNDSKYITLKEPTLAALEPLHRDFSAANKVYSSFKGDDRKTTREESRGALVDQLYYTSLDVLALAKKDTTIIDDSGYKRRAAKTKTSKKGPTPVIAPFNFTVFNIQNKAGEIHLSWDEVFGASTYAIEQRILGETTWKNGTYTSNNFIDLTGYPPGTIMEFRICTIGAGENKSEWTPVVGVWIS